MELDGIRVMVTGGAGFIGSHLVDELLRIGCSVVCLDNFAPYYEGKEENIQHNLDRSDFRLVKESVLDFENLLSLMKDVDVVFHLAAQPGVRYSVERPEEVMEVNAIGTLNVLEAARRQKVKKIVFASSSSVYGNPRILPVSETHSTDPISPYGISKLAAEKFCLMYKDIHDVNVVILRFFTVYGSRQRPDMAIYKFTKAILEEEMLTIYGDGDQTRDFTYVKDTVQGMILASQAEDVGGEIFNIGTDHRISINALLQSLQKHIGKVDELNVRYEPPRAADARDTHADISKAKRILGYMPKTSIDVGLRLFLDWYKNNKLRYV